MGGDGGSIPKRGDVVKTSGMRFARDLGGMGYLPNTQVRAESEKYRKSEQKQMRWRTCALTQNPLKHPIVACRLGQLYNKEAVLQCLMKRRKVPLPSNASHIKSLKDFRTLEVEIDDKSNLLVCPLSQAEFDGGTRGVFVWECGHVFASKALEQVRKTSDQCPICEISVKLDNQVIPLIPDDEELAVLKKKLLQLNEKSKKHKLVEVTGHASKPSKLSKVIPVDISAQ